MRRTRPCRIGVGLLAILPVAAPAVAASGVAPARASKAPPNAAAGALAGRWQGIARIPGAPAVIVLDLDQTGGR